MISPQVYKEHDYSKRYRSVIAVKDNSLILPFKKYGLTFKTVDEDDAAFILDLRTDEKLSKYLSVTVPVIELQKEWINKYKKREESGSEAYFVATNGAGEKVGLNRLYNYHETSFEIGSWLYKDGLDMSVPILGDLAARDYGFEKLNFTSCRFEVRKANTKVIKYHLGFNAVIVAEDELNFYYNLDYTSYKIYRDKLLKMFGYGHK